MSTINKVKLMLPTNTSHAYKQLLSHKLYVPEVMYNRAHACTAANGNSDHNGELGPSRNPHRICKFDVGNCPNFAIHLLSKLLRWGQDEVQE